MYWPLGVNAFTDLGELISNRTLMWVYLDKDTVRVRAKLDTDKMIREKAVDQFKDSNLSGLPRLPGHVTTYVKDYLGGKRNTRKKDRKKITKRKKHHSKSRKRKGRK